MSKMESGFQDQLTGNGLAVSQYPRESFSDSRTGYIIRSTVMSLLESTLDTLLRETLPSDWAQLQASPSERELELRLNGISIMQLTFSLDSIQLKFSKILK